MTRNMLDPRSITVSFPKGPVSESYMKADRSNILLGVGIAFIILEVIAFGLRVVARRIKGVCFGWDDAFIVSGLIFNLTLCALCMGE
jgi:hypothetical protein